MGGRLVGNVAVVSGGASGIGRAVASALAEEGATVVVLDKDRYGAEAVADAIARTGGSAQPLECDLLDCEAVFKKIDQTGRSLGPLDILVNCAGIAGPRHLLADLSIGDWDLINNINARGTFLLIRAVSPWMQRGGRIVNVSSGSAHRTRVVNVAYAASKGAVEAITRSAAGELAGLGINVNAVVPGIVNTGIHGPDDTPEQRLQRARTGPTANLFGCPAEVDDIAATVVFLCLPESHPITGQTVHVSAGATVQGVGSVRTVALPLHFSRADRTCPRPPPRLGEHTSRCSARPATRTSRSPRSSSAESCRRSPDGHSSEEAAWSRT
jgi:NAD(P)-dependent dehydrogenase (short-subunit alcohol dehydrogenase family)